MTSCSWNQSCVAHGEKLRGGPACGPSSCHKALAQKYSDHHCRRRGLMVREPRVSAPLKPPGKGWHLAPPHLETSNSCPRTSARHRLLRGDTQL